MENSNTASTNTAAEDLLAALADELTAILNVIGSLEAPLRIAEILRHSVKAAALAAASRTLLAQTA